MAPERRSQLAFVLVFVAAGLGVYQFWSPAGPAVPAAGRSRGGASPGAGNASIGVPDVRLEALTAERPGPEPPDRNLFRFGQRPAPPVESRPAPPPLPPVTAALPFPVQTRPPISLKFIGYWEEPATKKRVAALRDDRGVYHGSEGDAVEGRYKILRIGPESIEVSYLDGTGRQTIRLSGS
jgi:hypothetical protein